MKATSQLFRSNPNVIYLQPGPPADESHPISAEPPPSNPEEDRIPPVQAQADQPTIIDEAFAAVSQAEATLMELLPEQRTAIQHLTSGHTLVASATAAGVSRMTLHRWLKGDPAFTAAFNAWQKDVLTTARGRLLALSDLAVTTVAKSMSRGDAKTALKLLQSVGALDKPQPGSTDPDEIQRIQNLEKQRAQTALRKAETKAEMEMYEPM